MFKRQEPLADLLRCRGGVEGWCCAMLARPVAFGRFREKRGGKWSNCNRQRRKLSSTRPGGSAAGAGSRFISRESKACAHSSFRDSSSSASKNAAAITRPSRLSLQRKRVLRRRERAGSSQSLAEAAHPLYARS